MSNQNSIFGVHSITPYDLSNGKPLSVSPFKVAGTFSVNVTQEIIELNGGSSFDAWDTELGARTFEGSMLLREYPSALIEIATGQAPTVNAAEASGSVSGLRNVSGASAFDATTGIASVGVKSGSEIDVPFGTYIIEAVSATTVDIYVQSDVDFAQGADKAYVSGSQKINDTPLTITGTGGTTDIADFGLEITGGSGTVGFTVGDTAVFTSRPINSSSRTVNIGSPLSRPKNIGLIANTQRKSDGSMYEINIYNALVGGLPITMGEKAFSEAELTFKAKRAIDIFTGNEGLYSLEQVISTSAC
jgi:hypothetical protein